MIVSEPRAAEDTLAETLWVLDAAVQVTCDPDADEEGRELFARILEPWADTRNEHAESAHGEDAAPYDLQSNDGHPAVEVPPLTAENFERSASQLSSNVTLAALSRHRGQHILLHAGAIARPDGAVVAIIGPSGRGKTTTVRNLARHFGYVSDESVAITSSNEVLPYRKPLSVITDGHADKLQIAPSKLGLQPLPDEALRCVGLVLLDRRNDEGAESKVEAASLAQALVELVPQTSYLADLPAPLQRIAALATATGGVRRLTVGAQERIVEVADELFGNGVSASWVCEPWQAVMPGSFARARVDGLHGGDLHSPGKAGEAHVNDETYEAGKIAGANEPRDIPYAPADTVLDAIECADGTVVFTSDRQLRLLTGPGPIVWRGLCESDNWAELEARAEGELGSPATGTLREALIATCEDLVEAGVLRPVVQGHGATR